ncbi:MAG TPA: hypothetical protein VLQ93_12460 [Myxococcaceae bacterium]|nr:hypothetical protein [Myxococcaceae bacterium]
MDRMKRIGMGMFLAVSLLAGCGPETNEDPKPGDAVSARCDEATAEYLAFDVTHHAPQDLRLQKIDEAIALFTVTADELSSVGARADAVLAIYTDTTANLQAKVKGRTDVHFVDDTAAAVGPALDATILGAIEDLRNADTLLKVSLAKQKFEKAGMYRFLYLSVLQELHAPSKKHYDEAYGYFGSGPGNAEAGQKGLARLATKRDGNNGTTLSAELFAALKEGACSLETALAIKGVDSMTLEDDELYARFVRQFDVKLQSVFAYSLGHELFDIEVKKGDAETAYIKLVEGEGFFQTLEPYMHIIPGSAKATLAAELRSAFDDALSKAAAGDTSWIAEFDAVGLLGKLETAFGIDVKA